MKHLRLPLLRAALTAAIAATISALAPTPGQALPVDAQRAVKAAQAFAKSNARLQDAAAKGAAAAAGAQAALGIASDGGGALLHVIDLGAEAYVVVAGDDQATPILAYSAHGAFRPDDIAPGAAVYLRFLARQIGHLRQGLAQGHDRNRQAWAALDAGKALPAPAPGAPRRSVEPLLPSLWHQNFPYNSLCPADDEGNGGHVYAGCVATAMAQILRYWEAPTTGTGQHSYYASGYGTQSVDYAATTYPYHLMPAQLDSTSSDEEIHAIALLQRHTGVSVDMQYGPNGSGAYSSDVPDALQEHFGCNGPMMKYESRSSYTADGWAGFLRDNIGAGHPLYYSAQDDGGAGGHAFVCDGYDADGLFHYNWGWGGRDNGYFAVDALNTTNYAFNTWQDAIGGIVPNEILDRQCQAPQQLAATGSTQGGQPRVTLTWVNPATTNGGEPLASLDRVVVLRDDDTVHIAEQPAMGQPAAFTDIAPAQAYYTYTVRGVAAGQPGMTATAVALAGDGCTVTVAMHDSYGDGWNGAQLTLLGQGDVTPGGLTIGLGQSEATVAVVMPRGQVRCQWHSGNYDSECSFEIHDADGQIVYQTANAQGMGGLFFTFDNQCALPLACDPVAALQAGYDPQLAAVRLSWESPSDDALGYRLYRDGAELTLTAELSYDDTTAQPGHTHTYAVEAVYDGCEADRAEATVDVPQATGVESATAPARVYPNPARAAFRVDAPGMARIALYDAQGRALGSQTAPEVDASRLAKGLYFVRISYADGRTEVARVAVGR